MRRHVQPGLVSFPLDPQALKVWDGDTLRRLVRARDYLASRYGQRVLLRDAAAIAYYSPYHFNRLFLQAFKETPHEFVSRLRLEEAKRLLLSDNQSITDICFEVGYESLGSFSTRFRGLTGLSPFTFRREARRTFGGFNGCWCLFYIPLCIQNSYFGNSTFARIEKSSG